MSKIYAIFSKNIYMKGRFRTKYSSFSLPILIFYKMINNTVTTKSSELCGFTSEWIKVSSKSSTKIYSFLEGLSIKSKESESIGFLYFVTFLRQSCNYSEYPPRVSTITTRVSSISQPHEATFLQLDFM